MKKLIFTTLCALLCFSTFSQTEDQMKAWQEYMTPTESHQWLASMNGEWKATIKMWMDPSQPPSESKGTMQNKMIMDGRYQMSKHSGSYNDMPFSGQSLTAYDNAKKKFISIWIDNMGTGVMIMEGTFNKDRKILTMDGKMVDPMSGKDVHVREIVTYFSDDSHKFEMFLIEGNTQTKNMEINYTRSK